MEQWVDVAMVDEIANQAYKIVEINSVPIAIFNINGEFYAIEDNCPHQHLPIADGLIEGCNITCPYHGAKFCLKTGDVLAPPAYDNLTVFPLRILDNKVQIFCNSG